MFQPILKFYRHTITKTEKSHGKWKPYKIHQKVFKGPLKLWFLAMSHIYSFSRINAGDKSMWLKKYLSSLKFKIIANLSVLWWVVSWRNLANIHLKPSSDTKHCLESTRDYANEARTTFFPFYVFPKWGAKCWYFIMVSLNFFKDLSFEFR